MTAPATADDLALARRCAAGDAEAIRALEAAHFPLVRRALAKLGLAPDDIDETVQVLRVRLFVAAAGSTPAIATYDGRARLSTWLYTVAVRIARRAARQPALFLDGGDEAIDAAVVPASPELAYFRAQFRDIFDRAVREAIAAMSTRERYVLRCWATGMTLDEVASFYGVHRSTASRWIQASRDAVEHGTRAAVLRLTGMSERDYARVTHAVMSQLVSVVARALVEPGPG